MSLTVKENRGDFVLASEGLHIARCYTLIDLGIQDNKQFNNSSPKILIGWELSSSLMKDGRPFVHLQRYTASLSEKSKLRNHLESWRGKGFTPQELKGFHLENILQATCYLTLRHSVNPETQKKWVDLIGICPLPPAIVCPPLANKILCFDLDHYSEQAYLALPENIRKKINVSGLSCSSETFVATTAQRANTVTHSPAYASPEIEETLEDIDADVPF